MNAHPHNLGCFDYVKNVITFLLILNTFGQNLTSFVVEFEVQYLFTHMWQKIIMSRIEVYYREVNPLLAHGEIKGLGKSMLCV